MSVQTLQIVAIGEVLWDLLPGGAVLGGAPLNFAFRMGELGFSSRVLTRVGSDQLGSEARRIAEAKRMDCSLWQTEGAAPTGTVNVALDATGKPDFHIVTDVAYDRLEATEAALAAVRGAGCVYFGTLVQRTAAAREAVGRLLDAAEEGGALRVLDLNLRRNCHTEESIRASLARADVVKLSDDEAVVVGKLLGCSPGSFPDLAAQIVARIPARVLAITLGADGALALDRSGQLIRVPGERVAVADTCGCGDAFTAGFIGAYLRGASLEECVRRGVRLGSVVASQVGATEPMPSEVLQTLRS